MTDIEVVDLVYKLLAEITDLRSRLVKLEQNETDWRERWEAEHADHDATIKHFDDYLKEIEGTR